MEENEIVIEETPNHAEAETETAEDKLARLEETNKKLFERAKKAEAEAKASKGTKEVSAPKPSDILKADEFKLYRQGYSESEIDLIMHNGGMKAIEDEKSPLALGLKVAKQQRIAEDAASHTSEASGLSDIERKYTEQDMRNMSKEELEKLLPKTY